MHSKVYVIFVNNGEVGVCLDTIRLIASPSSKRFSHVTIRGPYPHSLSRVEWGKLNAIVSANRLLINGTGAFWGAGQNTVFFSCQKDNWLLRVWDKPDFPDVLNPHITIYDGPDREFASELREVVARYEYAVRCGASQLDEIELGRGTNGRLSDLIEIEKLPRSIDVPRDINTKAAGLAREERLLYIDRICRYLHSRSRIPTR